MRDASEGSSAGNADASWPGLDTTTTEAITYANSKGVAVIAAAGNTATPICNTPAWEDGAICVASFCVIAAVIGAAGMATNAALGWLF